MPKGFSRYVKNGLTPEERAERLAEVTAKLTAGGLSPKERASLISQRWRLANPDKVKAMSRGYYKRHPELVKARAKRTQIRSKMEVFTHYSKGPPTCDCCGEMEFNFLSVDHIGGGGAEHRRQIGGAQALYSWLRRNGYPPGYRILCFNCNLSIGFFGTCPHKRTKTEGTGTMTTELSHSEQQAVNQLESIKEMVAALECDYERKEQLETEMEDACTGQSEHNVWGDEWLQATAEDDQHAMQEGAAELIELREATGECTDRDDAQQHIDEDPLEISVRSDWYTPGGEEDQKPAEYLILLCTGGPACRIIGDLDEHGQPTSARLQHQDWGTPWTEWIVNSGDHMALMAYVQCFYFGE